MKSFLRKIIPPDLIRAYRFSREFAAAALEGFPSRKLYVIGVTGTNGKTTSVHMIAHILRETGYKVAAISSVEFRIGKRSWQNNLKMTMPSRLKLQRFIRQAVRAGCQVLVLEVTSEGISQMRHRFVGFNSALFTNLTPEHIEAHGNFEVYKRAKAKLFLSLRRFSGSFQGLPQGRVSIANLDDDNSGFFLSFPSDIKYGYRLAKAEKEKRIQKKSLIQNLRIVEAKEIDLGRHFVSFKVQSPLGAVKFKIPLTGRFNVYNALGAICVTESFGISLKETASALAYFRGVPGRMEFIHSRKGFDVVVDYAHTPDALLKVYQALEDLNSESSGRGRPGGKSRIRASKLICVLGSAGGGRDKWKRPRLGWIASKFCREIILTNEDPYDEDPAEILAMIRAGISKSRFPAGRVHEILDRRKAIRKALASAGKGDIIVITGKGREPWMCLARGKKIPWDDRKIVEDFLN